MSALEELIQLWNKNLDANLPASELARLKAFLDDESLTAEFAAWQAERTQGEPAAKPGALDWKVLDRKVARGFKNHPLPGWAQGLAFAAAVAFLGSVFYSELSPYFNSRASEAPEKQARLLLPPPPQIQVVPKAGPAAPAKIPLRKRLISRARQVISKALSHRALVPRNTPRRELLASPGAAPGAPYTGPSKRLFRAVVNQDAAGRVSVLVLDSQGRQTRKLFDATLLPGRWNFDWDGRDDKEMPVPSGTYRIKVQSGTQVQYQEVQVRVKP